MFIADQIKGNFIKMKAMTEMVRMLKSFWGNSYLRKFFIIAFITLLPSLMILNVLIERRSFFNEMDYRGLNFELGHLIDTEGCKIFNYDPSPPAMKKYFRLSREVLCYKGRRYNITTSEMNILYFYPENIYYRYHGYSQAKYLKAKKKLLTKRNSEGISDFFSSSPVSCCYKSIYRVSQRRTNYTRNADGIFKYGEECVKIIDFQTTITKHDAVIVYCKTSRNFYTNIHHLVQRKASNKDLPSTLDENIAEKLNVVIFGTDSISRLGFLRDNPKTYKYLMKDLEAYEFKGMNKVGENTRPNLAVILSGMFLDEMYKKCFIEVDMKVEDIHFRPFDDCSLIWKDFKRKGYITALVEDWPNLGIFNYRSLGFVNQPTDHYTRPAFLASIKTGVSWDGEMCHGSQLSYEILHDYSRDILKTYKNESTFSLFWATALTHDVLNFGVFTDKPHVKYLESLKRNGILNNTILFFMSDHGIRFGKFRTTYMGRYEENLPYLFIVVPEWFKRSYPEAAKNLQINSARLLTPFDIHETLRDILNQKYKNASYLMETPKIQRNISLFQKLPTTRTCADIGIPLKYCACQEYTPMENTNNLFEDIANYIKDYINEIFINYPECLEVQNLTVSKALKGSGEKSVLGEMTGEIISVQAEYIPGNALIEVTVLWDPETKAKAELSPFQIAGGISRINRYGNQSHCVTDSEVIKLCVCKDML